MFNQIRRVPYVTGDGKGGISYFAGSFATQFGMETQIVAAICESIELYPLVFFHHCHYSLTCTNAIKMPFFHSRQLHLQ